MEHLWSPAVATDGSRWQLHRLRKRLKQAKAVATGCDQLPIGSHGKEGVDGSSPSEGSAKDPQTGALPFGLTCTRSSLRWVWSRLWSLQVQSAPFCNLLERAADLLTDERRDGRFEIALGWTRFNTGKGAEAVLSGLAEAAERAAAAGNRVAELGLLLDYAGYELVFSPTERAAEHLRQLAEEALPVFEAAGDEWGLGVANSSLLLVKDYEGRSWADIAAAAERVIGHARRADDLSMIDWAERYLVLAHYHGPTPVRECLRWLDEHPEVERRSVLPYRDRLLAMLGRFDEANRLLSEAADRVTERGVFRFQTWIALLASTSRCWRATYPGQRPQRGKRVRKQ
jgi:hypothetical protein